MKVLIADALSDKAVEILKSAELTVDTKTGLKGEELQAIISDYDALIVRSATKATKDIIEKGANLKVIGRAGIGVDNVDVAAATEKGIVVMNTPQGNALAAAEHSIALIFAAARKIAYADRTMKEGKWEKKSLMGMELYEKTLGVLGIGNIGSIVAEKAVALGMRVIAYDLYISGLCSAVTFALYTVASESVMRRYSPWTVLCYAFTVAAIILNIIYPPFHALVRSHTLVTWWWVFFVTIFGTILPFAFYNLGIQRIRPTHASVTATLEPIAAAIISYVFLGEVLELWQIIGAILVIIAIFILQQKPQKIDVNQVS